jgi:NAD(P)-dependent dehydrogenase (short-subunit alcohol dehydrogenase family)
LATAKRLARDGFSILAVGRDEKVLSGICADITNAGGRAVPFVADVTSEPGPRAIVARALETFGGIDALVNAAGVIASGSVADTTDAAWDAMMAVNVRAPFRLIREAGQSLIKSRGAVVNVSSVAGLRAFPGVASYAVSKAAVDQLTRVAALDFAASGVRVNAVNPGVVVTNLHRRGGMDEAKYAEFLERSKTTHPLGRPGQPEEIADLIAYLISPAAGWITGETIAIDGGRHLTCLR